MIETKEYLLASLLLGIIFGGLISGIISAVIQFLRSDIKIDRFFCTAWLIFSMIITIYIIYNK
jgi:hypothetical protein